MPTAICIDSTRPSAGMLGTSGWRLRGAAIFVALLASLAFAGSAMAAGTSKLTVYRANGWGTGTITSTPSGMQCATLCEGRFANGSTVTLTAVPAADSTFTGWSTGWGAIKDGVCSGTSVTCTVTINADASAYATFDLVSPVRLDVAAVGGGFIFGSVGYVRCGNNSFFSCWAYLAEGSEITLQAVPADHSTFSGWSGACSGSSETCVVSMSEARSVTATFAPLHRVKVWTEGYGRGSIVSSPGGIDCGGIAGCEAEFLSGTVLTLTAVPDPGSVFAGWGRAGIGECTGTSPTCTITMDSTHWEMASFDRAPVHFIVSKAGAGNGSVTSDLGNIDCGVMCAGHLPFLGAVTLTAAAADGSVFTGWSGECTGQSPTCTVRLHDPGSVTATFDAVPLTPAGPLEVAPADLAPALPVAIVEAPVMPIAAVTVPQVKTRPALRTRPKITGHARAGKTLVCTRGAWSGSPAGYAFTWRRDGKVVGHGPRRLVRAADRGRSLRCDVTARNPAGASTVASRTVRIPR